MNCIKQRERVEIWHYVKTVILLHCQEKNIVRCTSSMRISASQQNQEPRMCGLCTRGLNDLTKRSITRQNGARCQATGSGRIQSAWCAGRQIILCVTISRHRMAILCYRGTETIYKRFADHVQRRKQQPKCGRGGEDDGSGYPFRKKRSYGHKPFCLNPSCALSNLTVSRSETPCLEQDRRSRQNS